VPLQTEDATILAALVAMAQGDSGAELLAFRSLVSAYQYRHLYTLLRRYVPAGAAVLDWGVGNGHFSYYLVHSGYQATGYTLTAWHPPTWLQHAPYRLVQGNPHDPVHLPFPDQSFAAVVSVGVLEHVRETGGNELASLREIRRILEPGGRFLCYHFPNRYSLIEAVARWLPQKYSHRYYFTRPQIRQLLRAACLELLEMRRYGLLPRNLWEHAPRRWRYSRLAVRLWDGLDTCGATLLAPLCQNHMFVAQREVVATG
jgi:ubiquinone/menaquinone biosynthesis C-methylase UbiE